MPEFPDQKLVEKALLGEVAAFRQLVEKYQRFAYRVAYRFVGTVGDAEDITQETFIRLWKNLSRYKPEIRMTTWLYKIVTNLCLDFLKSRYHRETRRTQGLVDHRAMRSEPSADQAMVDEELRAAMEQLSEELSPKQKAVFILRDLEEVSMPDIAAILSMSPGQVKSNLYYARKQMCELISRHYQTRKVMKP